MDLTPFKKDIDELIREFVQGQSTNLVDWKRIWLSKNFTYIYEAKPSSNLAFFMQTLYAQSIGYLVRGESLSHKLGGLYCLYCLYETQPFSPPFRVYLSLRELKSLKNLVISAKEKGIRVVPPIVKRMLEKNMFLFGFVDTNEASRTEKLNQLMELQNSRVQVAYKKLFSDTRIEHLLHMDLANEVDADMIKKMSKGYAEAKKLAIEEGKKEVDIKGIKHIVDEKLPIGDALGSVAEEWSVQREAFRDITGIDHQPGEELQQEQHKQDQSGESEGEDDDEFNQELEQLLSQSCT